MAGVGAGVGEGSLGLFFKEERAWCWLPGLVARGAARSVDCFARARNDGVGRMGGRMTGYWRG